MKLTGTQSKPRLGTAAFAAAVLAAGCVQGAGAFERNILIENFTTADCINCPRGHEDLEAVIDGAPDCIWVCHHAGYTVNSDRYQIPESVEYTWFYGDGGTFAPAVMFDRTASSSGRNAAPVMSVMRTTAAEMIASRRQTEAHAALKITQDFNDTEGVCALTVDCKADAALSLSDARLNVFLIEDGLVAYQNGKGSKYTHNHVIRAVVTPVWGEPVEWGADGLYSYAADFEIPWGCNPDHMTVVAFLSDYDADDICGCGVENALSAPLGENADGITAGVADCLPGEGPETYFTVDGRPASGKSAGLLIAVSVSADGSRKVRKIIRR